MTGTRFGDWRAAHRGKRRYPSRFRAWLAITRIWLRERRWDTLQPYTCRWERRWGLGQTAPPHIHIGHGKYTPGQRIRHQANLRLVWPFYRLRRRARARVVSGHAARHNHPGRRA